VLVANQNEQINKHKIGGCIIDVHSDGIFRYGGPKRRLGLLVTSRKT
jgi:hypothetical protein